MKHFLIEFKNRYELIEESTEKVIEIYPIKVHEHYVNNLGKINAINKIMELEKLPYLNISERLKKGKD